MRPEPTVHSLRNWILPGVERVAAQIAPYATEWEASNARARNAGPRARPSWAVLGDSLSQSIGASAFDRGWVHRTSDYLTAHGFDMTVVNLSRSGAGAADVLQRQIPLLRALKPEPRLVTLLVGSNDMVRRPERAELLGRFTSILQQIPAGAVVAYLPQPLPLARTVNVAIDQACASRGLRAVNIRPAALRTLLHRAPDLFHPNDVGYGAIADIFSNAALAALIDGTA